MEQISQEEYLKIIKDWKLEHKEEIESGKCRKIFLECLPKCKDKGVSWSICNDYLVYFIYDDYEGWIKIINFDKEKGMLKVEYINEEKNISYRDFKKYRLAKILNKRTKDFHHKIGQVFKDDKRDITIINKEYRPIFNEDGSEKQNRKWYKYHCNICNWDEGWMVEGALDKGNGCSCCFGRTVVEGINDIPTVAPWMVQYFQGGYEEAKLYTKSGGGNPNNPKGTIYPICPDCGRIRNDPMRISDLYNDRSIWCSCGDGISYPEKFMCNILEQLNIDFKTQLNKVIFKWCNKYKYDFYFEYNNEQYIIETHGLQHYEEGFSRIKSIKKAKTLEEVQENDRLKKKLALQNGIKEKNYIVIDCRKSELEWIENNIRDSRLNELFELINIDWLKTEEFACNNLVKIICQIKNNNQNFTVKDIEKLNVVKIKCSTILKYLKIGNKLGWCHYDAKEEKSKSNKNRKDIIMPDTSKPIEMFKDGILYGVFKSKTELSRESEKLFGFKMSISGIGRVCNDKAKQYKGYTFKYISKEEYEQRKEQEELKQVI